MKRIKKLKIEEAKEENHMAIGMSLGVCFGITIGAIVGVCTDNYALWMLIIALGIPLGTAIGSTIKK